MSFHLFTHLPVQTYIYHAMLPSFTVHVPLVTYTTDCLFWILTPGEANWTQVPPAPERITEHWINVTDLEHGQIYEFVVVAVNSKGNHTHSEPEIVTVGADAGLWQ